jgi:hypothetical protein
MGVTKVNVASLPKNALEYNLPGGSARLPDSFINLPIPSTTESGSYAAWIAARKTKSFIFW